MNKKYCRPVEGKLKYEKKNLRKLNERKPVTQFDVEENVITASHHVELFGCQHDLLDLRRGGA